MVNKEANSLDTLELTFLPKWNKNNENYFLLCVIFLGANKQRCLIKKEILIEIFSILTELIIALFFVELETLRGFNESSNTQLHKMHLRIHVKHNANNFKHP